jgi:hypothetical protein
LLPGRLSGDIRSRHARFARGADEGVRPYTNNGGNWIVTSVCIPTLKNGVAIQ